MLRFYSNFSNGLTLSVFFDDIPINGCMHQF